MSYLALYRKWRPKNFADIIGQEHISKTLQNALLQDRIAHAYLFCGPRGTGKTSSAKVFAKGVNCLSLTEGEPCDKCVNCEKINKGISLDVFEIDAASNRGVDEIRDLRERVKFAPTEGRSKIYIIDEVHMLTTEAFNALLKTLEEPPESVIFILATTEPHKIPLTILSRCQRFDFRPIGLDKILTRLSHICQQSEIEVELDALKLIAKSAEGGMRDALSALDQCISIDGNKVTVAGVNSILGVVNEETLYELVASILVQDVEKSLLVVNQVTKEGKDIQHFTKDLINGFRNLLVISLNNKQDDLIIASSAVLEQVKFLANKIDKENIISVINIMTEIEREMKWSNQPRLMLEMALIRACSIRKSLDLSQLIDKVKELELELQNIKAQGVVQTEPNKNNKLAKPTRKQLLSEGTVKLGDCNEPELAEIRKIWPKILEFLKKKDKMQIYAFLIEANPAHFDGKVLTLTFEHSFHKERVEILDNKNLVADLVSKGIKKPLTIQCLLANQIDSAQIKKESAKQDLAENAQSFFGRNVLIQVQD